MCVKITESAVKDKEKLSEREWEEIRAKIKEITGKLTHKDLKLIPNLFLNHPIWQLTVDEKETDHRVYIDVNDGETIVIAIWDFEYTHQGNNRQEKLEQRV